MMALGVALLLLAAAGSSSAFYLPGVAPQSFARKAPLSIKVNKLSSAKDLPYDHYDLPFCRPETIVASAENLGEVLRGDRIENSLYQVQMRVDEQCKLLCRIEALSKDQADAFKAKIDEDYRVNMILDNLPVAMVQLREEPKPGQAPVKSYVRGFPVGFKATLQKGAGQQEEVRHLLHNHLRFTILFHKDPETDFARVVGFEVEPFSVQHKYEAPFDKASPLLSTCNPGRAVKVTHDLPPQPVQDGAEVIFTYDVMFAASEIRWAARWDTYLLASDTQIHWFSIINSAMIVLFLSAMVAVILVRVLRRDISNYNQMDQEDAQEETGWKLVHGDVFRPPAHAALLSTLVGTGTQLLGMTLVTMLFAVLGFLSPANRGGLTTAMLMMFVFMGLPAGYASARLYKSLRGDEWRKVTLLTALLFPGICSSIFFVLNLLIWGQKSSGAVPFGTLCALSFLWFGISVPLVFVGSYLGVNKPVAEDPVRTNKIPRQVPEQPWYMNPVLTCLVGGVLPFGAVFIELFFILTSMWTQQFYYMFGFLALVFLILLITCVEITIVLCYFQLCSEDYHWWWRSFFTSGTSALYLFAYSVFYFYTKLDITKTVPAISFFAYTFMISLGFFALTGTVGFYSSLQFVRNIYAAVKID